jgi:flagellar capping protein FliD
VEFLKNLMGSLLRQAIIDWQDNHIKYQPKELDTQWALLQSQKSIKKGRLNPKYTQGVILAGLHWTL